MNLDIIAQSFQSNLQTFHEKWQDYTVNEPEPEVVEIKEQAYDGSFITAQDVWEDVKAKLDTNQFYAVSALGGQGSGKSTLGKEFFELALGDKFKCIYALPEDFIDDIDGWIERILEDPQEDNLIMLDDLSYASDTQGRKNQAIFKNVIARIRHKFTEAEEDNKISAKVAIIYVTHRLHAAPPMLRNSGSWIFTEMQAADRDDALEVIGKNKELRERLDEIYTFLNTVIFEGAKKGIIKYVMNEIKYVFKWGKQHDPGDGRLMVIYHAGEINIYNTKLPKRKIDLNSYRYEKPEVEEVDD
jgi:hypothetical protein